MAQFTFTEWRAICIADITIYAFYFLSLLLVLLLSIKSDHKLHKHLKYFFIRFFVMVVAKIAAGVCGIVFIHLVTKPATAEGTIIGLISATITLFSFSLGILMLCVQGVLDVIVHHQTFVEQFEGLREKLTQRNRVLGRLFEHKTMLRLVILSLTLISIGSGLASNDSTRTAAKVLEIIGSVMYLILAVINGAKIALFYINASDVIVKRWLGILMLTIPFLVVRVIYTLISAVEIKFNSVNTQFTVLVGKWYYYTFLGFLEECLIILIVLYLLYIMISTYVDPIDDRVMLINPGEKEEI